VLQPLRGLQGWGFGEGSLWEELGTNCRGDGLDGGPKVRCLYIIINRGKSPDEGLMWELGAELYIECNRVGDPYVVELLE
jgi:hypothetical protein